MSGELSEFLLHLKNKPELEENKKILVNLLFNTFDVKRIVKGEGKKLIYNDIISKGNIVNEKVKEILEILEDDYKKDSTTYISKEKYDLMAWDKLYLPTTMINELELKIDLPIKNKTFTLEKNTRIEFLKELFINEDIAHEYFSYKREIDNKISANDIRKGLSNIKEEIEKSGSIKGKKSNYEGLINIVPTSKQFSDYKLGITDIKKIPLEKRIEEITKSDGSKFSKLTFNLYKLVDDKWVSSPKIITTNSKEINTLIKNAKEKKVVNIETLEESNNIGNKKYINRKLKHLEIKEESMEQGEIIEKNLKR